jgi:hypothetical protein
MISDILNGIVDTISITFSSLSFILETTLDTFLGLSPKGRAFWGTIGLAVFAVIAYKINKMFNRLPDE